MFNRYERQIRLAKIGKDGQATLHSAKVLCVGAGGLGSSALLYLAGAGIGTLGICDDDKVALNNLHRQILYTECDVGKHKAIVAVEKLKKLNSDIEYDVISERITQQNVMSILKNYTIIIDATDSLFTKLLLNDACYFLKIPLVSASVHLFQGQIGVYGGSRGACLRCAYEGIDVKHQYQNCNETGVLGMIPGTLGILQALEVIKLCLKWPEALISKLYWWDLLTGQTRNITLKKSEYCPLCAKIKTFSELWNTEMETEISVQALNKKISEHETIFLLDVREPHEPQAFNLNGHRIPLGNLLDKTNEIPKDRLVVIYCYSGTRSAQAVTLLKQKGFSTVKSLTGGILQWRQEMERI